MDPIASFSGLASGIQWQDMIDQIMKLEAARSVDPLVNRASTQSARADAWKVYEGLVSKLRSASISLRDGSSFGIYKATAGLSPSSPFADTLRKVDMATKAVEKATEDMKTRADKEAALIESTNGFCQGEH